MPHDLDLDAIDARAKVFNYIYADEAMKLTTIVREQDNRIAELEEELTELRSRVTLLDDDTHAKFMHALDNPPEANKRLRALIAGESMQLLDAKDRIAELEQSFDLRWKAGMRAIDRWQKATGQELVWLDHSDLCVWLINLTEAQESEINKLKEENRILAHNAAVLRDVMLRNAQLEETGVEE